MGHSSAKEQATFRAMQDRQRQRIGQPFRHFKGILATACLNAFLTP